AQHVALQIKPPQKHSHGSAFFVAPYSAIEPSHAWAKPHLGAMLHSPELRLGQGPELRLGQGTVARRWRLPLQSEILAAGSAIGASLEWFPGLGHHRFARRFRSFFLGGGFVR